MKWTHSGSARQKSSSAKAGFSLIEVLAALVITTLLIVALTPFVQQMLATWARGSQTANLVEVKTRGLNRLKDDIRHTIVWTGFGQVQDLPAFHGDEKSLYFPVVEGLGATGKGIEYLSFTVDASVDGRALVRRRAALTGSTYGGFVDPVVLVSGPFKYVFKYYEGEGEPISYWRASWFKVPAHVELDIITRNGELLTAPIVIPIFASLSAACFVSGNLQGCPSGLTPPEEDNDAVKALGVSSKDQG